MSHEKNPEKRHQFTAEENGYDPAPASGRQDPSIGPVRGIQDPVQPVLRVVEAGARERGCRSRESSHRCA